MANDWFNITAKAGKTVEILIYAPIGASFWGKDSVESKKFAEDLSKHKNVENITVRINSPGGNVFDGNAIYNTLLGHKARVEVFIEGMAASIASVIAMAGDEVTMAENSMMMVHNPSSGLRGDANDLRKMADVLDKVKTGLVSAYHNKTKIAIDKLNEMLDTETWMTAKEAVKLGFADKMTGKVTIQNSFDMSDFKNTPDFLISNVAAEAEKSEGQTMPIDEKTPPVAVMPEINAQYVQEKHPEIAAKLRKEGAEMERKRLEEIDNLALPGHEALIAKAKTDGKTGGEVAIMLVQAERSKGAAILAGIKADAPTPVQPSTPVAVTAVDKNAPLPERCKAEWDKSANVRAEFGTFEVFLAFAQADEAGQTKINGGK